MDVGIWSIFPEPERAAWKIALLPNNLVLELSLHGREHGLLLAPAKPKIKEHFYDSLASRYHAHLAHEGK